VWSAETGGAALEWVLGACGDLIFAATTSGRILYLNARARERWPDARPGDVAAELLPAEARDRFLAAAAAACAGETVPAFDWGDEERDGVRAWFRCAVSPMREAGETTAVLCASSDVTALKRLEARLRHSEQLMVDTQGVAHLGTWEWDVREPHATWSPELYRIYGLSPESYTPSYEAYLTKVHPDDRQRVMDATNRVFHEHQPYSHDERIFRPDGSMRYLHTWAQPVLDEQGRLVRLLGVCQDITDRKLAEEEIHRLNADLERRVAERTRTIERSMRDLEAFNAMVSHDLRAPLTVLQLSCRTLLDAAGAELSDRARGTLARMQRSVDEMTELLNALLSLANVGNADLRRQEVDLTALSREIVAELERVTPGRAADVVVEPGMSCFADGPLLRAAMQNLLANAWKYTLRVPRARIEVCRAAADAPRAFVVRDNGAGFDMAHAHKLFQPFERLHDASEFEGTGVGLATVHRIIERHGGRIWAQGEPGRGAAFFFELPQPPGG
jgi:PAS domain S-box-containing protein